MKTAYFGGGYRGNELHTLYLLGKCWTTELRPVSHTYFSLFINNTLELKLLADTRKILKNSKKENETIRYLIMNNLCEHSGGGGKGETVGAMPGESLRLGEGPGQAREGLTQAKD